MKRPDTAFAGFGRAHAAVLLFGADFDPDAFIGLYSPDRLQRLASETSLHIKQQSAAAELALRAALACAYESMPKPPCDKRGFVMRQPRRLENGMPVLDGLFISLSHTFDRTRGSGAAAAAVSDRPVGVDIEFAHIAPRTAKRLLLPEELAMLRPDCDIASVLPAFWTAKESCAKLTGEGIAAMGRLSFDRGAGRIMDRGNGKGYRITGFEIQTSGAPLALSVCTGFCRKTELSVFGGPGEIAGLAEDLCPFAEN